MRNRPWILAASYCLASTVASAAPWDFLPWFGGDGLRDQGTPIDMRIHLRVGDETYQVQDSREGLAEAEEIMVRVFPGTARDGSSRMESSQVYALLEELLTEETNHAEALRVAGLNRREHFEVNLVLDDHTDPLTPGQVLSVPRRCRFLVFGCKDSYRVREGDTIESVAEEFGLSEDELRRKNRRKLDIHPHARHEGGVRAVYMGEAGLGKRSDDFDTFMHELGHVGDETSCGAGYGPDGGHRMSEILPPTSAFTEGWAQYQAAHLPGRRRSILADPPELSLETEVSEDEEGSSPDYVTVLEGDRTLNDYLANEARVGSILTALDALPPGREGVEAVFLETREDCRSIASIVGAYLEEHPELADEVRELLREWTDDVGDARDYEQLMAGILPRCQDPKKLPRSREYTPSPGARAADAAERRSRSGRGAAGRARPAAPGGSSTGRGGLIGGLAGGLFGIGPPAPRSSDQSEPRPSRTPPPAAPLARCDS